MKIVAKNKKAFYDYEIIKKYESGIILEGYEVKGIKAGKVSIKESFISKGDKALVLKNSYVEIPSYAVQFANSDKRDKKLLLKKSEIAEIKKGIDIKGQTVIPLDIYINDKGLIKLTIALAKGKKEYEKRETIKERDIKRKIKEEY